MKKKLMWCAALLVAAVANSFACTNLIVGKNASADGATLVSYSADSYGLFGELYHGIRASIWEKLSRHVRLTT